uniref:CUB domain-containing protein n=1 Tax=Ciona savignyi TaxID=51511 RepID=H2YCC5_CIOSA
LPILILIVETCNQALTAVSQPRRLTSPGYPGQYTNGLDCNYTITASVNQQVEITFNEFQTEPCCDYVEGSPSVPVSYTSTLNVLVVKFYTDSSVVRRGFNATYKQVTCGATETPTSEAQVFTSPDYPSNYPNNENCYWNFQAAPTQQVEVTFTAFNTESCCDFVEIIEDGQMTEKLKGTPTMPRTFTSVGQRLTVRFKSDGSVSRSGFSATY